MKFLINRLNQKKATPLSLRMIKKCVNENVLKSSGFQFCKKNLKGPYLSCLPANFVKKVSMPNLKANESIHFEKLSGDSGRKTQYFRP